MKDSTFADKDLILRFREGETDAFGTLLERYTPLIRSRTDSFSATSGRPFDEVWSEATLAFFKAIRTYDLGQSGVSFGLFAGVCIRNGLISAFSRRERENGILSIEDLHEKDEYLSFSEDPADEMADREILDRIFGRIRSVLSPYEEKVLYLWMEGRAAREIAKTVSRPEKSVTNAIARSIRKLRASII